jgi:hypothetical protein
MCSSDALAKHALACAFLLGKTGTRMSSFICFAPILQSHIFNLKHRISHNFTVAKCS